MIQREVQDGDNTRWQCVQAFSGVDNTLSTRAAEQMEDKEGKITVVCTPSGGAQTVRLQLKKGWNEQISDEELLKMIRNNQ